jgi:hypothetical protein
MPSGAVGYGSCLPTGGIPSPCNCRGLDTYLQFEKWDVSVAISWVPLKETKWVMNGTAALNFWTASQDKWRKKTDNNSQSLCGIPYKFGISHLGYTQLRCPRVQEVDRGNAAVGRGGCAGRCADEEQMGTGQRWAYCRCCNFRLLFYWLTKLFLTPRSRAERQNSLVSHVTDKFIALYGTRINFRCHKTGAREV